MNTQSIKSNRVESLDDVQKPGDFAWSSDFKTMFLLLPGESLPAAGIRVVRGGENQGTEDRPRWVWDGNIDTPTLSPSINSPGQWHGYLINGEFKSC